MEDPLSVVLRHGATRLPGLVACADCRENSQPLFDGRHGTNGARRTNDIDSTVTGGSHGDRAAAWLSTPASGRGKRSGQKEAAIPARSCICQVACRKRREATFSARGFTRFSRKIGSN